MTDRIARIASLIRNVPDFPTPGVQFKDITPLIGSSIGFEAATDELLEACPTDVNVVAGVESRGFIFAAPMALAVHSGFVPIRKPGKLPGERYSESFELEYGASELQMHTDAIKPGQRVAIIDDLLATGGTLIAAARLVERAGGIVTHLGVVIELGDLGGRDMITAAGLPAPASVIVY